MAEEHDTRAGTAAGAALKVSQPKPQKSASRQLGASTIIVSSRQKGNPVLNHIKSVPWEYGDIPADFLLGATTAALFLQLKYHRLHPEYIYTRIRSLQGKYHLRIVLVMVDIVNHEESLKELSKTSLINQVTLVLCWSPAEGGRYLELFKTFQNAAPTAIRHHQSMSYSDRMVDFVTQPRSVNKTDAVSLVSQFGTIKTAVNARHDEVALIAGWGERKVSQWCSAVRDPFRTTRAGRRSVITSAKYSVESGENGMRPIETALSSNAALVEDLSEEIAEPLDMGERVPDKEAHAQIDTPSIQTDDLDDGIAAALSKLRREGTD